MIGLTERGRGRGALIFAHIKTPRGGAFVKRIVERLTSPVMQ